jgi:predicted Zn-dependent protease
MKTKRLAPLFLILWLSSSFLSGCSSTPLTPIPIEAQELETYDVKMGKKIAESADRYFQLRVDFEIQNFLSSYIQKFLELSHSSDSSLVRVSLIQDQNSIWKTFSLPGNQFYVSVGLLKSLEYENELAALFAFEVSLLTRRVMLNMIESLEKLNRINSEHPLTWEGALSFSVQDKVEAAKSAVNLLYQAGFDPRGLSSLFKHYTLNPDHSPYGMEDRAYILDAIRVEVAKLPPLRNPIIRGDEFTELRRRMRRL